MNEQPVIVRRISWSDLCPWTLIFKSLPIATSVPVIAFALLGVILVPMGWLLSEVLFIHQVQRQDPILMEMVELNNSPYGTVFSDSRDDSKSISILGARLSGPRLVFEQIIRPFQQLFDGNWGGWEFCYFLFGSVWSIFVWSFLGLAITRVSLLRLTRNEYSGLDDAFEFAFDKWLTAAIAVGIPLAAVFLLCIPNFLIGLLMGFDVGVVVVGVIWFVVLGVAAIMALLLLGLMFGWPLIISSVAAESQNAFDAMTRAYAYTFQKPINYLSYVLVAILFGGICWIIVATLTDGVLDLAYWSTSLGANRTTTNRMDEVRGFLDVSLVNTDGKNPSGTLEAGRGIIGLWNSMLKTLAAAFIYGLFWCMAAAIYLLLRQDVDETEMDEVFINEEKRTYALPPLRSGDNGIPEVQTLVAVDEESESQPVDEDNASQD
jgi:hypothetical protein